MARIRTLAGGIAAWIALSTTGAAAPMSWFDSQATLTAWYANQLSSAGNIYAPPASASTISNLPTNWYSRPAPPQAVAPTTTYSAPAPAPAPVVTRAVAAPVSVAAPAPAPVSYQPIQASAVASMAKASPATQPSILDYTPQPTFGASATKADAFINMGSQPYAQASSLTTGNAQPWYQSPSAVAVFGGTPNADQQAQFEQDVLSKVEKTYALSGINVKLTDDPNVSAGRMLSVVSGASYGPNPDAIGITSVGSDGFSFIDKLSYAKNEDELSWAVARNVSHELMHAFGVGSHPDQTGNYIDAAAADWKMLTDPNVTFSPAAVSLLKSLGGSGADAGSIGAEILKSGVLTAQHNCDFCNAMQSLNIDGDQTLASPVPEPSTIAVWAAASLAGVVAMRRARQAS